MTSSCYHQLTQSCLWDKSSAASPTMSKAIIHDQLGDITCLKHVMLLVFHMAWVMFLHWYASVPNCSVPNCVACKTWYMICVSCYYVSLSNVPGYLSIWVLKYITIPIKWYRYDIFYDRCKCQFIDNPDSHCSCHSREMSSSSRVASVQTDIFGLCLWKSYNVHLYKPYSSIVICYMSYKPCTEHV